MATQPASGLLEEQLTRSIIGSLFDVHRELGPGFREYIYALAVEQDLKSKGHKVAREVGVTVYFRAKPLARRRIDMLVDDKVIVEIKTSEPAGSDATLQVFSYLCATDLELGLVLHFGRKPKFHRVICENRYKRRGQ